MTPFTPSRLAHTPAFGCLRSRREVLFRRRGVESVLPRAMPIYHPLYDPGELQFVTPSTYRRTPLFLSGRLRRGFVQRLEEVRRERHFLRIGCLLMPDPRRLAVVKLEVLLFAGCVHSPPGPDGLSSTEQKSLRGRRLPKAGVWCAGINRQEAEDEKILTRKE